MQVCMNKFSTNGELPTSMCKLVPNVAPFALYLPFDYQTEVVCTHSSGSGSHSGPNAFYAIDLATNYNLPPSIVRASADGKAFVFMGEDGKLCPQPLGTPANAQTSNCGNSWGNRIMILHSNGYASFYVHLERPLIKDGVFIHAGDPIGVEGWTGAAGHRHLHWSVQKIPGLMAADWTQHILQGWVGDSIPFKFLAQQKGSVQTFDTTTFRCAHANIGQAPSDQQPHLRGVQ